MFIRALISTALIATWAAIVFASHAPADNWPAVKVVSLPAAWHAPANLPETQISDYSFVYVESE